MKREVKIKDEYTVMASEAKRSNLALALIFLFSFLFVSLAGAEVAILKKALIWSADKTSDYILPEISGGVYATEDFVATNGQITSLTVNWQATGKINFEISADSGLNYTAVVNGVPLKSGFTSGNRLRWRATTLNDGTKLTAVNINYTDTAGVLGNFGEPILSGFLYRKEITLKKSAEQDLYNYQLKLKIAEGELTEGADINLDGRTLADFKDIRFTAADGQTPLPYYLETLTGESGSRTATVWVRVPQIPKAGVVFYLYYGNDAAASLSDPNATFDFYEDFTAGSLDKNKWILHTEQKGSAEVTNGAIKLDAAEIITKEFQFQEGIIEYSSLPESGFESSLNIRNKNEESYDSPIWLAYTSIYKGAEHCIAVDGIVKVNDASAKLTTAGEKYNYRITLNSGKITFERLNSGAPASASYDIDPLPKSGYLSLRSGGDGGGKNIINFGTLRVRKAASILPLIDNIGKEERVSLPVFTDTKLSTYGNVTLKDGVSSGYYISGDITAANETVRIIIPSWETAKADKTSVEVSISADSGATYKKECVSGSYYYASKKDFTGGTSLKARIDFSRSAGLAELSLDYRPGTITVTSPNGKENLAVGTPEKITWSAGEYEPTYPFNIEYSLDKGKNYTVIAENIPNSGEYLWTPAAAGKRALVKVSDSFDSAIFDASDKAFKITGAIEAAEPVSTASSTTTETTEKTKAEKEKSLEGKYDLLIKVGDSGAYKDGDIVMVKPAGYLWGADEKGKFVIARAKLTAERAEELMQPKQEEVSSGWLVKSKTIKTLNKRKYNINLQDKITAADRLLAAQGKLSGQPVEIENIESAAVEK